jgi:hypothetical protein
VSRALSLRTALATAAALSTLAAAEAASACNLPYISAAPREVGPGDTVRWTLANVEPRAEYTLTLAERVVAEGVAGASAPTGTFQMFDLGSSARDAYLYLSVSHMEASRTHRAEGYSNPTADSEMFQYRVPSAPEVEEPVLSPTVPPPAPAQPDKIRETKTKKPNPAPDAKGGGPGGRGPGGGDPAGRPPAPEDPAPARTPTVVPKTDQQVADEPAAGGRVEARAESRSVPGEVQSRTRAPARAAPERVQPSRVVLPPVKAIPVELTPIRVEEERGIPGTVLVAFSALLVVGLGGAAAWALRRPGSTPFGLAADGPQWVPPGLGVEARDLLVEAELQELIAEERARQVAREAAHVRTGPG